MIETIIVAAISVGGTWLVKQGLPVGAKLQTPAAPLTDSNIEFYKNLHEDIIIESIDAEDDTEAERFKEAQFMVSKHNKFAVKVHLIDFKDLPNRKETWTDYQKRLKEVKSTIHKARLELICQDEEYYKKVGRKLARELYPANKH